MASLDYNALRAQTLFSSSEEEAVTVNTRALVLCFPLQDAHFYVANRCGGSYTDR